MSSADLLRQIAASHQRGDLNVAYSAGEAGLTLHPDDPALLHMVGVLACQAGKPDRGAALLRKAYRAKPHPDVALNLARALLETGDLEEAASLCRTGERGQRIAGDFTRLLGDIFTRQGKFADAAGRYRLLVTAHPRDAQLWNNYGNALHAADQLEDAIAALERAAALAPQEAVIHLNLGRALATARRFDDSLFALTRAVDLSPDDATLLIERARALNRLGLNTEALPLLGTAARVRRDDPEILVLIGLTYTQLAEFDRAEQAHRMALHIDPAYPDAFLNLGILFEQSNRVDEIVALLKAADAAGVDPSALGYLRALAFRREGKFAEALEAARSADDGADRSLRAQLTGQLLDRLGDYPAAFAAFTEMNDATASEPLAMPLSHDAYRQSIEALTELTTPEWVAGWSDANPPADRAAPVFLVGFPRSGTTLLDTILMGHPDTIVLEEEPILQRVRDMLPDMAAVAMLDDAAILALRARYFAELDALHPDVGARLVIDKLPLNLLRTPLIKRIFPDAKFIFAKRHPCDVTLSCFMQNFKINQAMVSFLTIGGTARLYDRVMEFWTRCQEVFDLDLHAIRYEDMVADLEGELRPLLAFLGLEWSDSVLDHQRTAAGRGFIRTPSYAQVSEKIYARSSGRWLGYRAELAPVLPILAPWIERFGYAPVDAPEAVA